MLFLVSEAIYDVDLNRKIILFMIILDFELLVINIIL